MKPLVSILIPTYNRPDYLKQALKSALSQTYTPTEIIVSDNSDNDRTEQVVRKLQAKAKGSRTIQYVKNSRNIGPIANQRQCLELSTGEYINFLMDDDLLHPDKIDAMLPYMLKDNSIALVTSRRTMIKDSGREVEVLPKDEAFRKQFIRDRKVNGKALSEKMLLGRNNYIGEPTTVLFRKSDLSEPFGSFCGKTAYNNVDAASWLTLLATKHAVFLSKPLSYFRKHPSQLSKSTPSQMARLCDWIDHTIDAREKGLLGDQADYTLAIRQLKQQLVEQIPDWNRKTNDRYLEEILSKIRMVTEAGAGLPGFADDAKELQALLFWLELRKIFT
ncbi:glycosyltransferase family 2 protein [Paenibacillus sp. GCM10012303]|uniref:glycosyltransferase family 2 protein n=1 Tax=Paenibacillus sp. GCM10012303 TaxID=3317340 RepID=UPI00361B429A